MSARRQIAHETNLPSAQVAVGRGCDALRVDGVVLLVSGVPQPLEKFLFFSPAPHEVS